MIWRLRRSGRDLLLQILILKRKDGSGRWEGKVRGLISAHSLPPAVWAGLIRPGEAVRIRGPKQGPQRFICGSSSGRIGDKTRRSGKRPNFSPIGERPIPGV
jgi:hypothetical protein